MCVFFCVWVGVRSAMFIFKVSAMADSKVTEPMYVCKRVCVKLRLFCCTDNKEQVFVITLLFEPATIAQLFMEQRPEALCKTHTYM